ncbi:MAG TPA: DUF3800 domain-containing protein [Gammaproteobacteria bacterium]|nr:DUF3800 domain-containing protein [Gammaproteobacteria bacterium]
MDFEVYCDESRQDLIAKKKSGQYLMIGSLYWIFDLNTYAIFCDTKTNRDPLRLKTLSECLSNANLTAKINFIQALPSHQVVLIQLTDFLLGIVSAKMNDDTKSNAKLEVVEYLEKKLDCKLKPTVQYREPKY